MKVPPRSPVVWVLCRRFTEGLKEGLREVLPRVNGSGLAGYRYGLFPDEGVSLIYLLIHP